MTIPGGVTRFPNGVSVSKVDGIFADLPSMVNPRKLWEVLFDFDLKLDAGGADNEWSQFGTSSLGEQYPDEAFGVVQLPPDGGDTFGLQQENCQGFDFTRGTDLWFRANVAIVSGDVDMQLWVGMTDAEPTSPSFDTYNEACLFHVLDDATLELDVWVGGVEVQKISTGITMPLDGTYRELAYHYDGTSIFIAIDDDTVAVELMPVVPDVPLHIVMAFRDAGGGGRVGNFDYIYNAQLRQPL